MKRGFDAVSESEDSEAMWAMRSMYLDEYAGTLTRGDHGDKITEANTLLVRWSPEAHEWVEAHSWDEIDCIGIRDTVYGIIPNVNYSRNAVVFKVALSVAEKGRRGHV